MNGLVSAKSGCANIFVGSSAERRPGCQFYATPDGEFCHDIEDTSKINAVRRDRNVNLPSVLPEV
jgi:hypothetical protein